MRIDRLSREEIALRLLCAKVESGRTIGPADIREAFATAITFEERSDEVGTRPVRQPAIRSRHDVDGD